MTRWPKRSLNLQAPKNLDVSVKSAGLFAPENGKASLYAVEALFEKNIALNHTSSQLSEEKVEWADLVLTMTEQRQANGST